MSKNNDKDVMHRHAVISSAAYEPKNRMKYINQYYPGEYDLLKEYSDKHHVVVRHKDTGQVVMGVRGTDIEDKQSGRRGDLATDAAVTLGLHKLSGRYRKSDRLAKSLKRDFGKDNVSLTGHSLGGTIASELSHAHDLPSHSFNRGGSHRTFHTNKILAFHPTHRKRAEQNKVYLAKPSSRGIDPLSIGTAIDPLANIQFVKQKKLGKEEQGVIGAHSVHHFLPEKKQHLVD